MDTFTILQKLASLDERVSKIEHKHSNSPTDNRTKKNHMKTIQGIAYKATCKLYPSLSASIMLKANATHPEIVMGREAQCRQLDETVAVIAEAVREGQQQAEDVMLFLASAAIDMMTLHSPATEETMRDAIDRWKRWKTKMGRKPFGQNAIGEARADSASQPQDQTL